VVSVCEHETRWQTSCHVHILLLVMIVRINVQLQIPTISTS